MLYRLYAITRVTSQKIEIAEFSDLEFLKRVADCFTESDSIQKFLVTSVDINNNERLIYENVLEYKGKGKVR